MVPIKIQCDCGQRYAFEVEPVHGRMPYAVTCPSCGADGTAAANAILTKSAPAQPQLALSPAPSAAPVAIQPKPAAISLAAVRPTAPRRPPGPLPGQADRTQAKHEARAKISWGDPPREVLGYLMGQGFSVEEASGILEELVRERTAAIRARGFANIFGGIVLILVPIVVFIVFMSVGFMNVGNIGMRIFVGTVFVGLAGIWFLIKGCGMVISPKTEEGDAAGNN